MVARVGLKYGGGEDGDTCAQRQLCVGVDVVGPLLSGAYYDNALS